MNWIRNLSVLACILELFLSHAFAIGTPAFTLKIESPSTTAEAGVEVQIHVVLTNISSHGISITRSSLSRACNYRIKVKGPNGISKNEPGCAGSRSLSFTPLKPEESIDGFVVLTGIYQVTIGGEDLVNSTKAFDFSVPGAYLVQFSRVDLDDPDLTYITSNELEINIVPKKNAAIVPSGHSLSLAISADDGSFKVGEPILIHVVLTNISDEAITVPWSTAPEHVAEEFAIAVRSERGDMTKVSSSDGHNEKSLKPGQSVEGDCILRGDPLDFSVPGSYQVQFFSDERGDGNEWSLKSNKLTITVYQ
ncbi:MAG: hypothetical protein WBQ94_26745 [Terracidiphilus sp.]